MQQQPTRRDVPETGFAQAVQDVEAAAAMARTGHHEWACFVAQQAAGKAAKAAYLRRGHVSRDHRVARLLEELGDAPQDLVGKGRTLDADYVPARYPNGHPKGAPFEQYGPLQVGEAQRLAREVIDFARAQMA